MSGVLAAGAVILAVIAIALVLAAAGIAAGDES